MRYPNVSDIIALRSEIMALYNQDSQLRDKGEAELESALMQPQMAAYYEDADLARQAALLIVGIAQAHPFVDGNKRAALAAGDVMIQLNGYMVHSERDEFARQIIDTITRNDKDEGALKDFTDWLRSRLRPLTLKP